MDANPQLFCPIRGTLKAKLKAKDGLTFTEEKMRIDCINYLRDRGYPLDRIEAETVMLKFGHGAKNSLRADVVVYDKPASQAKLLPDDARRASMKIVCEIKRDNTDAEGAKDNQLKPALALIPSTDSMGIYWDDVEQSVSFKKVDGQAIKFVDASIASLPVWGSPIVAGDLHYSDLKPATDLVKTFAKLDDALHQAGHSKDARYNILFKLLLLKIFDETAAEPIDGRMIMQDFVIQGTPDDDIKQIIEEALGIALAVYANNLPTPPVAEVGCTGETLRRVCQILCGINIQRSSPQVIQDFFMYFGRFLYKVDLGQYFTPYEVIDLVVRIINPRFGDVVKDPACGTADFLVAAKRIAHDRHSADISANLCGVDAGDTAVNLSVFNMILNGDPKPNIELGDSLKNLPQHEGKYTVALCNPPFGTKIVERRKDVLQRFELGQTGEFDNHGKPVAMAAQETGLLFVEVCLRLVKPGGRVGIILPNGYLGNRSPKYLGFRRWLLKHARVAAVIGFPRFTFKKSGADVSASVVILEKRQSPLADVAEMTDHPIHFNLLERVGWDLQSNRSGRIYKRDPADGSLVLHPHTNEPLLDADFDRVREELYSSTIVSAFPWLATGVPEAAPAGGWVVQASQISARDDLCLDPKRWCSKHSKLIAELNGVANIRLGDVLRSVNRRVKKVAGCTYRYVEIEKIYENFGAYISEPHPAWSLPDRAKLSAAPGDVFIANIWSSAGKWLIAGDEAADGRLLVTTGCTHFEVIPGQESLLPDLVFGLSSEAFRVQMRALATGSDGLSSVSTEDILSITLPRPQSEAIRTAIEGRLDQNKEGHTVLGRVVREELAIVAPGVNIPPRTSHVAQV